MSSLQLVEIHRLAFDPEHGNDERESHRRLSRRHCQNEENEDLSVDVADLDAPTPTNATLAAFSISSMDMNMTIAFRLKQHPRRSDGEHQGGHRINGQLVGITALNSSGRARTTAPTMATSNSTEVNSNAAR